MLVPDAILPGTVTSLADFGAFVDLGGVQGLVPMSELSHSRVGPRRGPAERGRGRDREGAARSTRSAASHAQPEGARRRSVGAVPGRLRERQVVRGRAVRSTDFGVFVELLPGVDGLLHVSEIPRHQQGAMREAVAANAEITVMVVGSIRASAASR